jgi:hypothetical protein
VSADVVNVLHKASTINPVWINLYLMSKKTLVYKRRYISGECDDGVCRWKESKVLSMSRIARDASVFALHVHREHWTPIGSVPQVG